jgi:hypothetical protein
MGEGTIQENLALFHDQRSPRIVGESNRHRIKLEKPR